MSSLRTNRVKIKCLACKNIFDKDYRKRHNASFHKNEPEPKWILATEQVVTNPFAASAPKKMKLAVHSNGGKGKT
jgi:hypothetical protein